MLIQTVKDDVYRLLLHLITPSARKSDINVFGKQPNFASEYFSILYKHHILGSTLLLSGYGQRSVVCSSVSDPLHKAGPDTLYRVASITKMAVSLTVGILYSKGIIDIDASVSRCLPEDTHCDALERITLRQLLSHTSGITDPPNFENLTAAKVPLYKILNDPHVFTPSENRIFRYSNLGYGIIGCAIEYITGQNINDAMRSLLFEPLDMHATMHPESKDIANIMPISRVLPYRKGHDTVLTALSKEPLTRPDPNTHYGYTAGAMYADVSSLERLLACIRTSIGINNIGKWAKLMMTVSAYYGSASPTLSYGLGMQLISDNTISNSLLCGHQGFAYGCVDAAFFEAESGNTLIFLNGGCSESRIGRIGRSNYSLLRWSFGKEFPSWRS